MVGNGADATGRWVGMISPRRILAFLRRDVLVAISICGLALNLIGALGPIVALTRIAHYIVEHWVLITAIVWIKLFKLFHIDIPPLLGFALTMFVFHVGLVITSGLQFGKPASGESAAKEAQTISRDRLLALLLYLPIMWGTLSTAFGALAKNMTSEASTQNSALIVVSFCVVVLSPILAFWLARPRQLIRRFISVYVVAGAILLLDAVARMLEATGVRKTISEET